MMNLCFSITSPTHLSKVAGSSETNKIQSTGMFCSCFAEFPVKSGHCIKKWGEIIILIIDKLCSNNWIQLSRSEGSENNNAGYGMKKNTTPLIKVVG